MSAVRSSTFGLGSVSRSFDLLGELGVMPIHVQQTIDSPNHRASVAAAYRGDLVQATVTPADWIEREMAISAKLAELDLPAFEQYRVEYMSKGGVGPNDRFISEGLNRLQLLEAINKTGLRLYGGNAEGADNDGDAMPTNAGIITLGFAEAMAATDIVGRPYYLNMTDQLAWSKEQGGDGLMSAEEVLYLFLRSIVERGRPLWAAGSCRCANAYGADRSLYVDWFADNGLYVSRWGRSAQGWDLGALPRKWQALGT